MSEEIRKSGLYERTVGKITEWVKPSLHGVTQRFVDSSVDKYAKNNSKYARIIEFEVRRRGDGAGLTQDVAEPLLWTGVKTAAAVTIAVITKSLESGKFKIIGYAAALGLILNNAVELFRLVPRYVAGLQGSLEMAKDRWRSIEEVGVDPFNQQSREINKLDSKVIGAIEEAEEEAQTKKFSLSTPSKEWAQKAIATAEAKAESQRL